MSLDQKLDVTLPLWEICCPSCDLKFIELTEEALARTFNKHIRNCKKLLALKNVVEWRAQNILDEMLTVMIQDLLTDRVRQISYNCGVSIKSLRKQDVSEMA